MLAPAGYAGTYDVTLSGRGQGVLGGGGRAVSVAFRWTTPTDGELDVPRARLAVLADNDGEVDSYGVELAVSGLARSPAAATALVTVTSADGRSLGFEAKHENMDTASYCLREGSLFWDGPDARGLAAARLGPAPFTYDVVLTLDGVEHTATVTWPDDQVEGDEPSVALEFRPALPRLVARGR